MANWLHSKLCSMCIRALIVCMVVALYLILKLFSLFERREKPNKGNLFKAIFEIAGKNHKINNLISPSFFFFVVFLFFFYSHFHQSPFLLLFCPSLLFSLIQTHFVIVYFAFAFDLFGTKMHEQFHFLCSVLHGAVHLTLSMHIVDENDSRMIHQTTNIVLFGMLYVPQTEIIMKREQQQNNRPKCLCKCTMCPESWMWSLCFGSEA